MTKSSTVYTATPDGSSITFRVNNPSEATIHIDNTTNNFDSTFSPEDEVTIKIGTTTMMVGFITSVDYEWTPSRRKNLKLQIVDYGSYLSGKTPFEITYKFSTPASFVFSNASAQITGLTTNITAGLTASDKKLKREFYGTYVKDHWYSASEVAGADFFVDELKVLQVWPHKSALRALTASNGQRYKIQDSPSSAVNQVVARLDRIISYSDDATNKFNKVTVTNGIYESFPENPHTFTSASGVFPLKENGVLLPYNFGIFGASADWNPKVTTSKPITIIPEEKITIVGGTLSDVLMPVYQINIKNTSMQASLDIKSQDSSATPQHIPWQIAIEDWDSLVFMMKAELSPAPTVIDMYMIDDYPTNSKYFVRNIYDDFLKDSNDDGNPAGYQRGGHTIFEYPLTDLNDVTKWTKVGTPTKINSIQFAFRQAGSLTGYTAGTGVKFGYFHFYRKRKSTATTGGSPTLNTRKIIVDASAESPKNLTNLAKTELERIKNNVQRVEFTITGNTDFRKPGYIIDYDFTSTLGSGKSGSSVRLDEITHRIENGIHFTEILINDAFQRN